MFIFTFFFKFVLHLKKMLTSLNLEQADLSDAFYLSINLSIKKYHPVTETFKAFTPKLALKLGVKIGLNAT